MLKPFSGEKICPVEMGPKNGGFGENGGLNLRFWFRDPKKHTSLRGTASFDVFCVKIGARVSAVAFLKNPRPPKKNSRVTLCRGARKHACAEPKPLNRFGYNFARW